MAAHYQRESADMAGLGDIRGRVVKSSGTEGLIDLY